MKPPLSTSRFYVYIYRNPLKGNQPFYVGKGKGKRAFDHLREKKSDNPYKHRTIQQIKRAGLEPVIEFACKDRDEETAFLLEQALIAMWGRVKDGGILTNICLGGEGASGNHYKGKPLSEERRRQISEFHRGNTYCLGRKASADARRHMSEGHRGHRPSRETIAKMSASQSSVNRHGSNNCHSKLTEEDVREIRSLKGTVTQKTLAGWFGVSPSTISKILSQYGGLWSHL